MELRWLTRETGEKVIGKYGFYVWETERVLQFKVGDEWQDIPEAKEINGNKEKEIDDDY